MDIAYLVQIQYDPTIDYGCGIDMTTRDTLHVASSPKAAQTWMRSNAEHMAQEYAEMELVVTAWMVNAVRVYDREQFSFAHE